MFTQIIQLKLATIILIALISAGLGILVTYYLKSEQIIISNCSPSPKKSWIKPHKATMTGTYY